jgi:iron(III) transport system permease protein
VSRPVQIDSLDFKAKLVLLAGAGLAVYLILVPLGMLLFAAFRGPSDYLPFEPGARWTLENFRVYAEGALYSRILPDTFVFVAGTVALTFTVAFALAWLIERTDLPGREIAFAIILFPLLVPIPVLAIAWIFLMGPECRLAQSAAAHARRPGRPGSDQRVQHGRPDPLPVACLGALRVHPAERGAAQHEPGARGGERHVRRDPVHHLPRVTLPVLLPGLLAPLILITLITAEQFRAAADDRAAVAHHRVQLSHLFRAQSGRRPAELWRRRRGLAAVRRLRRRAADALQPHHPPRRKLRHVTGKGVSPAPARARRVARSRSCCSCCSTSALAAIVPALVLLWTSFFGYTLPTRATAADFSTEPYRQLFANPAFWTGLKNTALVAGASAAIVTAIGAVLGWIISRSALPGRRGYRFPLGDVGRHSGGDRRACRDGALSVAADRRLRHGADPDPCLFVSASPPRPGSRAPASCRSTAS